MSVIVGTSSSSTATEFYAQRKLLKSSTGVLILIAQLGSVTPGGYAFKISSDNGVNWSSWTQISTSLTIDCDAYIDSNDDIFFGYSSSGTIYFRRLTWTGTTWTVGSGVSTTLGDITKVVITKRSNNDIWIAGQFMSSSLTYIGYSYSTNGGSNWTSGSFNTAQNSLSAINIYPLGSNIAFVVAHQQSTNTLREYLYTASMTFVQNIGDGSINVVSISTVKVSDTEVYTAIRTTSGIRVFSYNGAAWSSTLLTDNSGDNYPTLGRDNSNNVFFVWSDYVGSNSYNIKYLKHTSGGSWGTETAITTDNANNIWLSIEELNNNFVNFCWTRGTSSPYDIVFDKITIQATIQETINSDIWYKTLANQYTINSDIYFTNTHTQVINSDISFEQIGIQQTILSDIYYANTKQETILSDIEFDVLHNGKFIHNTRLYIPVEASPAQLIEVNIAGVSPTWTIKTLNQTGEVINNIRDLAINHTTEFIYVCGDNGKVSKINIDDLDDRTAFTTYVTEDLYYIANVPDMRYTYIADNLANSLFVIDETTYNTVSMDMRFLRLKQKIIRFFMNFIFGVKLACDIRFLLQNKTNINTDMRFQLSGNYTPIKREDFLVTINTVEADVLLTSIRIVDTIEETGTKAHATFKLVRKHDKINYKLDGTYNQITYHNQVKIYLKGIQVFLGLAETLKCDGTGEYVEVQCRGVGRELKFNRLEVPLSDSTKHIDWYDALSDEIEITNPAVYFGETNPSVYHGVQVDLGTKIEEQVEIWTNYISEVHIAEELEEGIFRFDEGYTYFWWVDFNYYNINSTPKHYALKYIGTSVGTLSTDLYEVTGARYFEQKIKDNKETILGNYTIGIAPFKVISAKNGQYIGKDHYEDREDGIWLVHKEGYDYIDYAQKIAYLEYQKLLNISGAILPLTKASLELTLDAYLYYDIRVLSRINLNNTTEKDIYKRHNGFPVSVKELTIDSQNMSISLSTDNIKSAYELAMLDGLYPDQDDPKYIIPGHEELIWIKTYLDRLTEEEI